MKLLKRFKNLFTPKEEEKLRRKTTKMIKKKTKKKVKKKIIKKKTVKKKKIIKKIKSKPRKKALKKIKKKETIKKKIKKKVVKKKAKKKVKKKSAKPLKSSFEKKEIGVITHYFGKISVGIVKLKSTLRVGEKIHIKGAHDDFTQTIKSMQINHQDVSMASKGSEIGIIVLQPVHENDRVYKI